MCAVFSMTSVKRKRSQGANLHQAHRLNTVGFDTCLLSIRTHGCYQSDRWMDFFVLSRLPRGQVGCMRKESYSPAAVNYTKQRLESQTLPVGRETTVLVGFPFHCQCARSRKSAAGGHDRGDTAVLTTVLSSQRCTSFSCQCTWRKDQVEEP